MMERNLQPKTAEFYIRMEDGSRGPIFAQTYTRLVIGGRGEYVEFDPEHLLTEIEVEPGQEYRLSEPWLQKVCYLWYRTKIGGRKLYFQRKTVNYADYLVGKVYVAPCHLIYHGHLYAE